LVVCEKRYAGCTRIIKAIKERYKDR